MFSSKINSLNLLIELYIVGHANMDTKLVICELLAYIFDAREYITNDAISDTLNTFYCEE